MKKTFPVNINGKVFYIDEDAYDLLLNYLKQLRISFSGDEGEEIVNDIENRISELFDEHIAAGASVITFSDVNQVIEIMGRPSDISDSDPDNSAEKTADSSAAQPNVSQGSAPRREDKKLYRDLNNKVFGGVLGGVAAYLGWEPNILRILYVVLTILTQFWPLTIIYLIAWMVIPAANTPRRILEMQGQPVTVDTIGQTVLSTATPPPFPGAIVKHSTNFITSVFTIAGKCILGFLGLIGAVGAIIATGFFLFFLVALISVTVFGSLTLIEGIYHPSNVAFAPVLVTMFSLCFALCFIIPGVALAWMAATALFHWSGANRSTIIFSIILEILIIVSTFIFFFFAESSL